MTFSVAQRKSGKNWMIDVLYLLLLPTTVTTRAQVLDSSMNPIPDPFSVTIWIEIIWCPIDLDLIPDSNFFEIQECRGNIYPRWLVCFTLIYLSCFWDSIKLLWVLIKFYPSNWVLLHYKSSTKVPFIGPSVLSLKRTPQKIIQKLVLFYKVIPNYKWEIEEMRLHQHAETYFKIGILI